MADEAPERAPESSGLLTEGSEVEWGPDPRLECCIDVDDAWCNLTDTWESPQSAESDSASAGTLLESGDGKSRETLDPESVSDLVIDWRVSDLVGGTEIAPPQVTQTRWLKVTTSAGIRRRRERLFSYPMAGMLTDGIAAAGIVAAGITAAGIVAATLLWAVFSFGKPPSLEARSSETLTTVRPVGVPVVTGLTRTMTAVATPANPPPTIPANDGPPSTPTSSPSAGSPPTLPADDGPRSTPTSAPSASAANPMSGAVQSTSPPAILTTSPVATSQPTPQVSPEPEAVPPRPPEPITVASLPETTPDPTRPKDAVPSPTTAPTPVPATQDGRPGKSGDPGRPGSSG